MRYRRIGFLLLVLGALSAQAENGPSVSITKLQVQKQTPAALDVHFFNEEGVWIALNFSLPNQVIVGVNKEASKLTSATNDKGTDLTKGSGRWWMGDVFSRVSDTKHEIAMPIHLPVVPAPGATTIQLKGEIVITCGSQEKTETSNQFDLNTGTSVQFGAHSLAVSIDQNQSQTRRLKMISGENSYWLKKVEFVDEQGNVIKTGDAGSESRNGVLTQYVTMRSDVKTAALRVTYFGKLDDVSQSVDMKIGLGIP